MASLNEILNQSKPAPQKTEAKKSFSLAELTATSAPAKKSTPINLNSPEVDSIVSPKRTKTETFLDTTSGNLFSGVGSTAGAVQELTGKTLGLSSRLGGYLGEGFYKGLGKVVGVFSEKGGTTLSKLGDQFQAEMEAQRDQFRQVGKDQNRFLSEGGQEAKKIIMKNTGYEDYQKGRTEDFKISDLKDPQFLLYDMYGSLIENAPMMIASIYTGGKVAGATGASGTVAKFLANVSGTTGFSTTLNALREAEGKYSEILNSGGTKEQAFLESERVFTRNASGNAGLEGLQMALLFAPQLKVASPFLKTLLTAGKLGGAGITEALQERMEDEIQAQSEAVNFDYSALGRKLTDPNISKTDVISATMGILVQGIGGIAVDNNTNTNLDAVNHAIKTSEAFPIEATIKADPAMEAQIYANPETKVLTEKFAQGRIQDVAQKAENYQKGLGEKVRKAIDAKNTTYDNIIETGLKIVNEAKVTPDIRQTAPNTIVSQEVAEKELERQANEVLKKLGEEPTDSPVDALERKIEEDPTAVEEAYRETLDELRTTAETVKKNKINEVLMITEENRARNLLESGSSQTEVILALSQSLGIDLARQLVESIAPEVEARVAKEQAKASARANTKKLKDIADEFQATDQRTDLEKSVEELTTEVNALAKEVRNAKPNSTEKKTLKQRLEEKRKVLREKRTVSRETPPTVEKKAVVPELKPVPREKVTRVGETVIRTVPEKIIYNGKKATVLKGTYKGKPYTTNAHILEFSNVKGATVTEGRTAPDSDTIQTLVDGLKDAKPLGEIKHFTDAEGVKGVVFESESGDITVDVKNYNHFLRKFPDMELKGTSPTKPVGVYSKGELVGLIMPLQPDRAGGLKTIPVAKKPVTQKEKVQKVVKEKGKTDIKTVAKELPDLPEPTIRRILGQGAKDGTFERVDKGVYVLKKDGQDIAYIETGSALEVLPRLAKEGFKADMVFLDIPYDTPAVKGGNRGVNYKLVSLKEFSDVLDSVKQIARHENTPIVHMYSTAPSGMDAMQKYNDLFIEKGFNVVGKGDYTKLTKTGKRFGFPTAKGWQPLNPEGILVFTYSGKLDKDLKDLNFKLVRPKGYQTEKPAEMLLALVEMTTEEGDVVLDPFAGSGVAVAEAVRANRKGVAIEVNPEAVEKHIKPKVEEAVKNRTVATEKKITDRESDILKRNNLTENSTRASFNEAIRKEQDRLTEKYGTVMVEQSTLNLEKDHNDLPDLEEIRNKLTKGQSSTQVAESRTDDFVVPQEEDLNPADETAKNEDVGEKIGGAQKDLYTKQSKGYEQTYSNEELLNLPLAKMLPPLDYQNLIQNKVPAFLVQAYIYNKTRLGRRPNKRSYKLGTWLTQVQLLRQIGQYMFANDIAKALDGIYMKVGRGTDAKQVPLANIASEIPEIGLTFDLYEKYDYLNDDYITKFAVRDIQKGTRNGKPVTLYYVTREGKYFASIDADTTADFFTAFDQKFKDDQERRSGKTKKESVFANKVGVYRMRSGGEYIVMYKNGQRSFTLDTFKTLQEAREAKQNPENMARWEEKFNLATGFDKNSFREKEAPTIGQRTYRTGDVSADEFMQTFGFRGVEFGNWLSQEDRRVRLNAVYDSLKDLAKIVGVPDNALSLNGELGFAFGSRGKKGASAHYEPDKVVINITKENGAGTIAHEWWHALDNYLSRRSGNKTGYVTDRNVTYERKALNDAIKEMVQTIVSSDIYKRSSVADQYKGRRYYTNKTELGARAFEIYVREKLAEDNLKNGYLVQVPAIDSLENSPYKEVHPYAVGEEVPVVVNAVDKVIKTIEQREEGGRTVLYKTKDGTEVEINPENVQLAQDFLADFKERMKLDFDVFFVDNILAKDNEEAYGVTFNNTIALTKDLTSVTAQHEVVHLTLDNMDKIDAFKGITADEVLSEKAKEMGIEYTPETRKVIEEKLALDFEQYVLEKHSPVGKIKAFFEKLLTLVKQFVNAIKESEGSIIKEYYDTLLSGVSENQDTTRLENMGIVQDFIKNGVLDTRELENPSFKETITLKLNQIKTNSFDMGNARDDFSQGIRSRTKSNILVQYHKGQYHLIDGHHRLVEARARGNKTIKADVSSLSFKLKEDRHFANLKDKHNRIVNRLHDIREKLDRNRVELAKAMRIREIKQDVLAEYVEKGVTSLTKFVGKDKALTDAGIRFAEQQGYDAETINETLTEYMTSKEEYLKVYKETVDQKNDIASLRKEDKQLNAKRAEIVKKLKEKKTRLEQMERDIQRGFNRGVKAMQKFNASRRGQVRELQKAVGISSAQTKRLIRGRNFETMNDKDFDRFMQDMIRTAKDLTEKEALQQGIMAEIQYKQYSKFDNLRLALGLPSLTSMNKAQLQQYQDALAQYEFGDVFLSKRQIETSERTDWGKIVTVRDLTKALKENTNLTLADLKTIDLPKLAGYANGLRLSRHSELLKYVVDNLIRVEIETERSFLEHRNRIEKIAKEARKSRKRSLKDKVVQAFIPTDELVFEYVEVKDTDKEQFAKEKGMTPEEVKFGNAVIAFNRQAYDHMKEVYELNSRFGLGKDKDYMVHIRRSFLEAVRGDGFVAGLREMFDSQKEAELSMSILDGKTGEIVPYEKWSPFHQFRAGDVKPTQNVTKAHLTYAKTFYKKSNLDSYIPKLLMLLSFRKDILSKTKEGLPIDGGVENFIKEYINNARGRKINEKLIPKQGGSTEAGLNMAITATTLLALGGRIGIGTASAVGEFVVTTTSMILHPVKLARGITRTLQFKQAKKVRENARAYIGINPLEELMSAEKGVGERAIDSLMLLFSFGRYISHTYALQANLKPEEWKEAQVSTDRLLEISKEQNKFKKGKFHAGSLVGSTVIGRIFGQYLSWAFDIATTTASSATRLVEVARTEGLTEARKSEYMRDLTNFTATAIVFGLLAILLPVDEEDEENRTILWYIRREMNTLVSAFPALLRYDQYSGSIKPTVPLIEKGVELFNLSMQLITQEAYKRDGKGYGIGDKKFVRTATKLFVPVFIQELTGAREERDTKNRLLQEAIDSGTLDTEAIASVIVQDWDEKDDEYKTEKKGEIEKLHNLHKTYGFDNDLVNIILHGDGESTVNNEERAELMVEYSQQNGVQETKDTLIEMRKNRNLCTNPTKKTGCFVSDRLWKDYIILLRNKGL